METEKYFEQILNGEEFTPEQKIQILKSYVGEKVYATIQEHAVRSKALGIPVVFSITNASASEDDIKHFLKAIGARNYSVEKKNGSGTDMG